MGSSPLTRPTHQRLCPVSRPSPHKPAPSTRCTLPCLGAAASRKPGSFSSGAPRGCTSPSAAPKDSSAGIKGGLPRLPAPWMLSRQLPGGADFIPARLSLRTARGGGAGVQGRGGGGRRRPRPAETERPARQGLLHPRHPQRLGARI
jgi:hypothetical protein